MIVSGFPFIMTLYFWDGKNSLVPIYNLWSMSLSKFYFIIVIPFRLGFKVLYHSLHIR